MEFYLINFGRSVCNNNLKEKPRAGDEREKNIGVCFAARPSIHPSQEIRARGGMRASEAATRLIKYSAADTRAQHPSCWLSRRLLLFIIEICGLGFYLPNIHPARQQESAPNSRIDPRTAPKPSIPLTHRPAPLKSAAKNGIFGKKHKKLLRHTPLSRLRQKSSGILTTDARPVRPILRFFAAAFLTVNNPGLMLPSHKFLVAGRDFPLFIMIGLLLLLLATLAHQQPFNFPLFRESVFPRWMARTKKRDARSPP